VQPNSLLRAAAFLDRDGVLNIDHNYVHRPDQWDWTEGSREAIKWLNEAGFLVVVVTNQSGIGRGLYTEEDLHALHEHIQEELAHEEARIDAFYHCPHRPEDGCKCRKPLPGMIDQAVRDMNIDRARSFLIGDKERDVQAGLAAGVQSFFYLGGSLLELVKQVAPNGAHAERA
jgi:D-glycero-D-manno-heptose 1,7-bisphosphate phosphatase